MTAIRTRVTTGSIEGQETDGVAVFTGIPYATIPARFAAPRPPGLGRSPLGADLRTPPTHRPAAWDRARRPGTRPTG